MKVFQIRCRPKSGPILARAGYQPDLQKGRISAGAAAGAELRYRHYCHLFPCSVFVLIFHFMLILSAYVYLVS